uniref:Endonuclease/exonuclease/phosphatase domain-containing protein n=1 Tax=Neogobius melanostomus TaxID=47308 RepID=A0A8C6V095_9GOBI
MANSISFLSWNVRGLNVLQKRLCTWDVLQRHKIEIAMLQETHLLETDVYKMQNNIYRVVTFSSFSKKSIISYETQDLRKSCQYNCCKIPNRGNPYKPQQSE